MPTSFLRVGSCGACRPRLPSRLLLVPRVNRENSGRERGKKKPGEITEPTRAAFIDHMTVRVRNLEASRRFYEAGRRRVRRPRGRAGDGGDLFRARRQRTSPSHPVSRPSRSTSHLRRSTWRRSTGLTMPRRPPVAATTAGRALRPQYHASYYAAYVLDPDSYFWTLIRPPLCRIGREGSGRTGWGHPPSASCRRSKSARGKQPRGLRHKAKCLACHALSETASVLRQREVAIASQ